MVPMTGPVTSVATPCTGVCAIEDDLCRGCARTLDEIAAWGVLTNTEREAIMARLPTRRPAHTPGPPSAADTNQAAAAIAASSNPAARR